MKATLDTDSSVRIVLSSAEALVLSEWFHRNESHDVRLDHLGIADDAERQVLWSMSACLESTLVDPFRSDYLDILETARASLRSDEDNA